MNVSDAANLSLLKRTLVDKRYADFEHDFGVALKWIEDLIQERDNAREEARRWKAGYERLKGGKG